MKKLWMGMLILAMLCVVFVACNGDSTADKPADSTVLTNAATTTAAAETTTGGEAATTTEATTTTAKSPWENGDFSKDTQHANDSDWTPEF